MFINPDIFRSGSLEQISAQLRFNIIEMSYKARSAHLGSCLSCVDILTALYFNILKVNPSNPEMPERDIFILSKGHAAMALYSVLAARGFFNPEMLKDYNQDGGVLAEHPPASGLAGVEAATGSLGHGLPISTGQALAMKLKHAPQRVFCLLSDGETNEGSVWEAALFASAQKLNNLI
ncbi:MAG: thiamine pyrophosphate-dependent enzyme, partial [Alphaproteobacteria bacterium]|nr:thiamine pyrophosphate-dependent enzyme [Alphaproteobacteria bacterium]